MQGLVPSCVLTFNITVYMYMCWVNAGNYLICSVIMINCEVKSDHRSKFSNLSNWKEEAWKNQGFNGIRTRDLRDTGAMLYQLSYEATHWERGQFIEYIFSRAVKWCEVYMK